MTRCSLTHLFPCIIARHDEHLRQSRRPQPRLPIPFHPNPIGDSPQSEPLQPHVGHRLDPLDGELCPGPGICALLCSCSHRTQAWDYGESFIQTTCRHGAIGAWCCRRMGDHCMCFCFVIMHQLGSLRAGGSDPGTGEYRAGDAIIMMGRGPPGDNAYRILCRQSAESDRVPRRFRSMSGGAPTRNLRPAIAQKDYY